jgi:hypothetical protein
MAPTPVSHVRRFASESSAAAAPAIHDAEPHSPSPSPDFDHNDEDDDDSPSTSGEGEEQGTWSRLLSSLKSAASAAGVRGQSIFTSGVISTVPAPTIEGAAGSRAPFDQRGQQSSSSHFHGKPRDRLSSPGAEAAESEEQAQLMASYMAAAEPSPSPAATTATAATGPAAATPREEREASAAQGPVFHDQPESPLHQRGAEEKQREEEEHKQQEVDLEAGAKPTTAAATTPREKLAVSKTLASPEEMARQRLQRRLSSIADPEIRRALDPESGVILSEQELLAWPDERLIAFVRAFDLADMEGWLLRLRTGKLQVETARASAAELTTALSWRNLSYSIDGTVMLQNLSGYVRPGQLVAVLGGPDAGITSSVTPAAASQPSAQMARTRF